MNDATERKGSFVEDKIQYMHLQTERNRLNSGQIHSFFFFLFFRFACAILADIKLRRARACITRLATIHAARVVSSPGVLSTYVIVNL